MPRYSYPGYLKQKKGNKWKMVVSVNGKKHYGTCTARTKEIAANKIQTWYDGLVDEAAKRAEGIDIDRTLLQHIDEYREHEIPLKRTPRTRQGLEGMCDRLEYWLRHEVERDPKVTKANRGLFFRYLRWRKQHQWRYKRSLGKSVVVEKRVAAPTLRKERVMLHALMELALQEEIIETNPVSATKPVKVPDRELEIATREQVDALEEEMRGDMRKLYVRTMYETAARPESEVLWIRWQDIDFERRILRIQTDDGHTTKTHKSREIPLSDALYKRLRAHEAEYRNKRYAGKRSPWLFHHTTDRYARPGNRITTMRHAFDRAAEAAGLPDGFGQHDLRHTRITHWLAEGFDHAWVQQVAGHEDPKTTAGYTHLAGEDLRRTMDRHNEGIDPDTLQSLLRHADPAIRALAQTVVKQTMSDD